MEPVGKLIFFRLIKNVQMQGARNPEECGVLECTLQRRRTRGTPQMGVFQQPVIDLTPFISLWRDGVLAGQIVK
jgi:hypothetical protein